MIDLTVAAIRKRHIDELFEDYNIQRKNECIYNYEFYQNCHKEHIYEELCKERSVDSVRDGRNIFSINITKKVVEAISTVYLHNPYREFIDADEREAEGLEAIYALSGVNAALKKANKYFKLLNQVLIQVVPSKGGLTTRVLSPQMYDVIVDPEDPEEALAIIQMHPNPAKKHDKMIRIHNRKKEADDFIYSIWTAEAQYWTDSKGQLIRDEFINPIGRLPFIEVCKDKNFAYWIDEKSMIVEFAKEYMLCLSDTATIAKIQGYAQAVLASEEKPEDIVIGPRKFLWLQLNPNSAVQPSFGFQSPNPDLQSSIDFAEKLRSTFLSSIGVPPTTITSNSTGEKFTSGQDRFLAGIERFEASKDDFDLFQNVEDRLFELIRDWSNVIEGAEGTRPEYQIGQISQDVTLNVEFARPELVQTDMERCNLIEQKLRLGLISRAEAIMHDRGVSREEAELILAEIGEVAVVEEPVQIEGE